MLLFILVLCCQSIDKDARTRVIHIMSERELDSLRLDRGIGNMKLYSDNIGSSRSIGLFFWCM